MPIKECPDLILFEFLDKYMLRPKKLDNGSILSPKTENRTINEILIDLKQKYENIKI